MKTIENASGTLLDCLHEISISVRERKPPVECVELRDRLSSEGSRLLDRRPIFRLSCVKLDRVLACRKPGRRIDTRLRRGFEKAHRLARMIFLTARSLMQLHWQRWLGA